MVPKITVPSMRRRDRDSSPQECRANKRGTSPGLRNYVFLSIASIGRVAGGNVRGATYSRRALH